MPEILDRPTAYELKASINDMGKSVGRRFLRSVVMGDIWFTNHSPLQAHRNVISVGSSAFNGLTGSIAGSGKPVRQDAKGRWHVLRDGHRWALFGDRAEDTYDAVIAFKDRDLPQFLDEIWTHL